MTAVASGRDLTGGGVAGGIHAPDFAVPGPVAMKQGAALGARTFQGDPQQSDQERR